MEVAAQNYAVGTANVGASWTRFSVEFHGKLAVTASVKFPTIDYAATTNEIVEAFNRALRQLDKPVAMGICVAGNVVNGVVKAAGNLPESWVDKSIEADLAERLGLPVVVKNDCEAEALAAATFSGDIGVNEITYVGVGTGVGVGEATYDPSTGLWTSRATERGHDILDLRSRLECGCSKPKQPSFGHAERLLGGKWLPDRFGLNRVVPDFGQVTDEQWADYLSDLAAFIRNLSARKVAVCALGGGVIEESLIPYLPLLQRKVNDLGGTTMAPRVIFAGTQLGLHGAACAAQQLLLTT